MEARLEFLGLNVTKITFKKMQQYYLTLLVDLHVQPPHRSLNDFNVTLKNIKN